MEITISLVYQCVQIAAIVFLAGWIITMGKNTAGRVLRSLALFSSIAALVLLYLSRQEEIKLSVWIYLGISILTFLIFALDKLLAVSKQGNTRIPENVLIFFSLFGVLGGISGMLVFHHKNKKAKLQFIVPIIAVIESILVYFIFFRTRDFTAASLKPTTAFQWMAAVTTAVFFFTLIRTFILVRVLVIIPLSLFISLKGVGAFYKMDSSISMKDMIAQKPIPFLICAAVIILILELIAVKSKFFTSGNEVRKKTDHSGEKA